MVDAERLSRLLARITADVAAIRATAAAGDPRNDPVLLRAIKYGFVTAIEGCVRAAQHIVAAQGFTIPETNAGAVRALGKRGAVSRQVADQVALAVGFRNVLVHQYADVDDERVLANLALLPDLDRFVVELGTWASRSIGPGDATEP